VTNKQQKFALITRFKKKLREKGLNDSMNMYAEQWPADDLIKSYSLEECYKLVDYYFEVTETPSWKWFIYNADKVYSAKRARDEDNAYRKMMRSKAKEWLQE